MHHSASRLPRWTDPVDGQKRQIPAVGRNDGLFLIGPKKRRMKRICDYVRQKKIRGRVPQRSLRQELEDFSSFARLTYAHIGMYILAMARAATTSDAFNAVAEPRRRDILNYLALQERPVGDIVLSLGMEQPSVSKHLRVLRDVGLVRVRRNGRHIFYRTNADAIRPLHEWTKTFEPLWRHQLSRVKERAEAKQRSLGTS
jgi:DNA-binding transcriptional ArsR family regulator